MSGANRFGGRYKVSPVPVPENWPQPASAMFHGPMGDIARSVWDLSEADPAAIVGALLAYSATIIGPEPTFSINGLNLRATLFMTLVGPPSQGRKGTATRVAREAMEIACGSTAQLRLSGFGSGEALVSCLAEREDRKVLIEEAEFGQLLTVGNREGSTLSPMLRKMWDGEPLANLVKDSQLSVDDYHACMLGHITPEELRRKLSANDRTNGFSTRFLLVASHRRRRIDWDCGGDGKATLRHEMKPAAERLGQGIESAADAGCIGASDSGWEAWIAHRERDGESEWSARRAEQLGRLALVYALADGSAEVTGEHIEAAAAVCDYSEATARAIFGTFPDDPMAERVWQAVRSSEDGLSMTELQRSFKNHLSSRDSERVIEKLVTLGYIERRSVRTDGRSKVVLIAVKPEPAVGFVEVATKAAKATKAAA